MTAGRRASTLQPLLAGVVGTVTGFFGSVAVLLAGLTAAGATAEQAASGLVALCVAQGVLSIVLSWRLRIPVCFAWSTPGAALLVAAHREGGSFGTAVGAFLLAGVLTAGTGAVPALARFVDRIPPALTGALLAGVLLPFCLAPVTEAVRLPLLVLPLVAGWLLLSRFAPRAAGPVVIVTALVVTVLQGTAGAAVPPLPMLAPPALDPVGVVALGVPLYLVTMAGQHLPGFAVLRANGYVPPTRPALVVSGLASAVVAPFGGVGVNLAAITGAIMVGHDAGEDRSRRWLSGVASGCTYLLLAGTAGLVAGIVGEAPPALVEAAAGLALLGAFVGAVSSALERPDTRVPAAVTFLIVGSGIAVAGVGSAFWGLLVGGIALAVLARRPPAAGDASPMP
ncbi:benzoate/H(+) symporter BenE family transporter [Amnibacterium sp.]|uniref:benzoate/H(+) symporter BenE family transporter n=1 Tax=Amnibacterium sp. TaxID=1872496 RepID=UPI00260531E3|nr:benzoate/H(+) symporter BenE family transporter [Amnibacterium sp.]MCU1473456.1 benE [Amnibacterium sp.]